MNKKILLLGAGGFIGSHLTSRLVQDEKYLVTAVDIEKKKLVDIAFSFPYFHLDVFRDKDKLKSLIADSDIVVNMIAIANPGMYVKDPLYTFKLDFQENLWIVEQCVELRKRLIHFSTSEVYGKSPAQYSDRKEFPFDEDESNLILGPIKNHRWIYASSKQLLERVIHAYGLQQDLNYTIIRPFNYIGPKIDFLPSEEEGVPRVFSYFMDALLNQKPMSLVNGGEQKRCYTDIRDATDAHMLILGCEDERVHQQIINVGHVDNEVSIIELAEQMNQMYKDKFHGLPVSTEEVTGEAFYGEGYDDSDRRIPVSSKVEKLGWKPRYSMSDILSYSMSYYINGKR